MNNEDESVQQFSLLSKKRFGPFFATQFLGAMNDNIYKNSLMLLLVFQVSTWNIETNTLINLAAALFILPFFLFSGLAGRIGDKYDKAKLIRHLKILEIIIMCCAATALLNEHYVLLLVLLFFMGTQSAFFGPIKYSILPQHLNERELIGGNGLIEMGTFVAILLGTLLGGILIGLDQAMLIVSVTIVACAAMGFVASSFIPESPPNDAGIKLGMNLIKHNLTTLKKIYADRSIFLAILAISWFWFMGASYLTQIPNFVKIHLNGDNQVVTLILASFSIGVALGSLICEKLSRRIIELGIVPIGSIGISGFGVFLYAQVGAPANEIMDASTFLSSTSGWSLLIAIAGIGFSGGLFIVPLYAWVQNRCDDQERSQIISGISLLNAFFMVMSAVISILLLSLMGLSILEYFLLIALVNIAVAMFVYSQVPEFMVRFLIWVLSHTIYRVKHKGLAHVPRTGAAVLVCNHVTYLDALILGGAIQRPIRFVMFDKIYDMPALNWFFKAVKAIPITPQKLDPVRYEQAFESISQALKDGEIVCIFPEGKLTKDGELNVFKRGVEMIIDKNPAPVVPMALKGLWGSFFSHHGRPALTGLPKRFWSKVELTVAPAIAPDNVSADGLRTQVLSLLEDT